jgi:hypothetical protein
LPTGVLGSGLKAASNRTLPSRRPLHVRLRVGLHTYLLFAIPVSDLNIQRAADFLIAQSVTTPWRRFERWSRRCAGGATPKAPTPKAPTLGCASSSRSAPWERRRPITGTRDRTPTSASRAPTALKRVRRCSHSGRRIPPISCTDRRGIHRAGPHLHPRRRRERRCRL